MSVTVPRASLKMLFYLFVPYFNMLEYVHYSVYGVIL